MKDVSSPIRESTMADPSNTTPTVPAVPVATLEMWPDDAPLVGNNRAPAAALAAADRTMPPLDELDDVTEPVPTRRASASPDTFRFGDDDDDVSSLWEASSAAREARDAGQVGASKRMLAMYGGAFVGGILMGTLALAPWTGTPLTDNASASVEVREAADGAALVTSRVESLVDEGFAILEADPGLASDKFRAVLDLQPGHPSASYGLGLAHLAEGRVRSAKDWLCRASQARGAVGSSARSTLDAQGISCR